MKKYAQLMGSFLFIILFSFTSVYAQENDGSIGVTFEGNSEEFITYEQGAAYEALMPGEERVQKVVLTNNNHREMKFFIRADYVEPLGEGTTEEEIAYDIRFAKGDEEFFQGRIGGVTKANMNSLETNYLLETLQQGQSTTIDVKMKIDGDSMGNEYQGAQGNMNLILSVEYDPVEPMEKVVNIVKKIPVVNMIPGVNTGDSTAVGLLLGLSGASIVTILVIVIRKKKRKEDGHE